jgi:hypothetical protein
MNTLCYDAPLQDFCDFGIDADTSAVLARQLRKDMRLARYLRRNPPQSIEEAARQARMIVRATTKNEEDTQKRLTEIDARFRRRFSPGGLFDFVNKAVKWVGNACRTAGRAISGAAKLVVKGITKAAELVGNIPIIGKALSGVLNLAAAPFKAIDAICSGVPLDKVALGFFKDQVTAFRDIAPLAQSIVSLIPGIGTGVAAAIGGALACAQVLVDGRPIDQALLDAVKGAVPGGAIAGAVFSVAEAACSGQPPEQIALAAAGGVAGALGGGAVAKQITDIARAGAKVGRAATSGGDVLGAALSAAQTAAGAVGPVNLPGALGSVQKTVEGAVRQGESIVKGVEGQVRGAVGQVQGAVDKAMGQVTGAVNKATGQLQRQAERMGQKAVGELQKKVRGALAGQVQKTAGRLAKQAEKTGMTAIKNVVPPEVVKGLQDVAKLHRDGKINPDLLKAVRAKIPTSAQKAFDIALAVGQARKMQHMASKNLSKLPPKGLEALAKHGGAIVAKDKSFEAARKLVPKAAQSGYDMGLGMMSFRSNELAVGQLRSRLSPDQQKGFDMALSVRVGRVTAKAPPAKIGSNPAAVAGYYATYGMAGGEKVQKKALMTQIAEVPEAREGAAQAVVQIAQARVEERKGRPQRGWLHRMLQYLGLKEADLPLSTELVATTPGEKPPQESNPKAA